MIEMNFLRFYFVYVLRQEKTCDWSIHFCWFISLYEKRFLCLLFSFELEKEKIRIISFATVLCALTQSVLVSSKS